MRPEELDLALDRVERLEGWLAAVRGQRRTLPGARAHAAAQRQAVERDLGLLLASLPEDAPL
jgi:hypothetical protein